MTQKNNMMKIFSTLDGVSTFKLIPLDSTCRFIEAVFHPGFKILVVIDESKYTSYRFIPKVDDNGNPEYIKGTKQKKEQRILLESWHEHKITDRKEIEAFVNMFTIDGPHNLEEYFKVEKTEPDPVSAEDQKLEVIKDGTEISG